MSKEKQKKNKELYSILTGEVIEDIETAKDSIEEIDTFIKDLKKNKKQIKENHGLDNNEMVVQRKKYFYKLYKGQWEGLDNISLSTFKVLKILETKIHHQDNSVIIKGARPSYKELSELCNLGLSTFKKSVKELVDIKIIKTINKGKYSIIYFNPNYIEDSMTEKWVHDLFDDS